MKRNPILSIVLILAFLAGCGGQGGNGTPQPGEPTLPAPAVRVTSAPDAKGAILDFLEAWSKDDYASMYAQLTQESQQSITVEDFDKRYRDAMNKMTLKELSYEVLSANTSPTSSQVTFRVGYKTNLVGEFQREMTAGLKLENGQWKIQWEDGLVLPELRGGNRLDMNYDVPTRGFIYDSKGQPFATQTDAYAISLVPSAILPEQEGSLMSVLSELLGIFPIQAQALYNDRRDVYWYVPLGEAPAEQVDRRIGLISSLSGLAVTPYNARLYYLNGVASQAVGYVSSVPVNELDRYVRAGYSPAARVGSSGIEQWGEQYLAGKTGGTLYVVDPNGKIISSLGKADSQPASNIQLTMDRDFQLQAEKALAGLRGSVVVMERDTGRVLAMVSSPGFDPNIFEPNNPNSAGGIQEVLENTNQPLVNRATQGQYPLGSVFKVITFAAALESETYTPDLKLECGYEWTELNDKVRYDWTWEHFQDELATTGEGTTKPSGTLTLSQGLMRSCNPWFWHIGLDLFRQGRVSAIADMARGFGLGALTGIGEVEELPGQINNPPEEISAVNQAIGQGDVQVTPLQVATFMAALGNGGTLYRPQLVEKIIGPDGTETTIFKPEARGTLPVKPETLDALREAMLAVVRDPRGTAVHRFRNISIPIFGKTGTAESGSGLPHAWFAGYTDAQIEGVPDIAIAVIVENKGEGSEYGAPIFKRIAEIYFFGRPLSPYWWESNIGITRTPTPLGGEATETPTP